MARSQAEQDYRRRVNRETKAQRQSPWRGYEFISGPTRENPNYMVRGPGGRNDIRSVPAGYFALPSESTGVDREVNQPGTYAAARFLEETQKGLKINPSIGYPGGGGQAPVAPPIEPNPFAPPPPGPLSKPYTLLPGFAEARVRRQTLLSGLPRHMGLGRA